MCVESGADRLCDRLLALREHGRTGQDRGGRFFLRWLHELESRQSSSLARPSSLGIGPPLTATDRTDRNRRVAKPSELTSEQLRRSVSETLKRVGYGRESIVVTLHGKAVAMIVPMPGDDEKGEKRKAKPS